MRSSAVPLITGRWTWRALRHQVHQHTLNYSERSNRIQTIPDELCFHTDHQTLESDSDNPRRALLSHQARNTQIGFRQSPTSVAFTPSTKHSNRIQTIPDERCFHTERQTLESDSDNPRRALLSHRAPNTRIGFRQSPTSIAFTPSAKHSNRIQTIPDEHCFHTERQTLESDSDNPRRALLSHRERNTRIGFRQSPTSVAFTPRAKHSNRIQTIPDERCFHTERQTLESDSDNPRRALLSHRAPNTRIGFRQSPSSVAFTPRAKHSNRIQTIPDERCFHTESETLESDSDNPLRALLSHRERNTRIGFRQSPMSVAFTPSAKHSNQIQTIPDERCFHTERERLESDSDNPRRALLSHRAPNTRIGFSRSPTSVAFTPSAKHSNRIQTIPDERCFHTERQTLESDSDNPRRALLSHRAPNTRIGFRQSPTSVAFTPSAKHSNRIQTIPDERCFHTESETLESDSDNPRRALLSHRAPNIRIGFSRSPTSVAFTPIAKHSNRIQTIPDERCFHTERQTLESDSDNPRRALLSHRAPNTRIRFRQSPTSVAFTPSTKHSNRIQTIPDERCFHTERQTLESDSDNPRRALLSHRAPNTRIGFRQSPTSIAFTPSAKHSNRIQTIPDEHCFHTERQTLESDSDNPRRALLSHRERNTRIGFRQSPTSVAFTPRAKHSNRIQTIPDERCFHTERQTLESDSDNPRRALLSHRAPNTRIGFRQSPSSVAFTPRAKHSNRIQTIPDERCFHTESETLESDSDNPLRALLSHRERNTRIGFRQSPMSVAFTPSAKHSNQIQTIPDERCFHTERERLESDSDNPRRALLSHRAPNTRIGFSRSPTSVAFTPSAKHSNRIQTIPDERCFHTERQTLESDSDNPRRALLSHRAPNTRIGFRQSPTSVAFTPSAKHSNRIQTIPDERCFHTESETLESDSDNPRRALLSHRAPNIRIGFSRSPTSVAFTPIAKHSNRIQTIPDERCFHTERQTLESDSDNPRRALLSHRAPNTRIRFRQSPTNIAFTPSAKRLIV